MLKFEGLQTLKELMMKMMNDDEDVLPFEMTIV